MGMKAELLLDTDELTVKIAQDVIKALSPLLTGKASPDTVYTVESLAEYLKAKPKWIREHTHILPHFKLDGLLRFRKRDIDKMIEQNILKNPTG